MSLDFTVLFDYYPILLRGLYYTVIICFLSLLSGMVVGMIVCQLRLSRVAVIRQLAKVYINLVRSTPFLVQVYLIYFVGPQFGLTFSAFVCGYLTLTVFGSAYFAEIYRAGIEAVPKGHLEAARALGMTRTQTFIRIVFPQMMALIIPMLTNELIILVKESAVLSTITVYELTFSGSKIIGETYRYLEVYLAIALMYWTINTMLSIVAKKWETYFTRYMGKSVHLKR